MIKDQSKSLRWFRTAVVPARLCIRKLRIFLLGGLIVLPILAYQCFIAPLVASCCRFQPRCSIYAQEAITKHGAGKGLWLIIKRLIRCHPWGGSGYDPVP